MIRFKDFSLGIKQGLLMSVLSIISLALFITLYYFKSLDMQYSHVLRVAERQGLVLQQLIEAPEKTVAVEESVETFSKTLVVLKNGGTISSFAEKFSVPATQDEQALQVLAELQKSLTILEKNKDQQSVEIQLGMLAEMKQKFAALVEVYVNLKKKNQQKEYAIIGLLLMGWLIVSFLTWRFFRKDIARPIQRILVTSQQIADGKLTHPTHYRAAGELGKTAIAIDAIIEHQLLLSNFAEQIGEGNFNVDFSKVREGDKLGMALLGMRDKLLKVSLEDKKRNWSIEGLAKFAEILRSEHHNVLALSDTIIVNLVKYMNANQGAIFLVYDEDKENVYAEAIAVYAWERKRYLKKRVPYGEGLVGQVIREGDTIYMTDIPSDYVNITSGLGKANPKSLLIVPLKINEEIHGVVELASFVEYGRFEIEFVEKMAESIASALASVKVNEKTKQLLNDSQMMNEQMRAQEEEMRQNMEELSATQEEMQRKEVELMGIFKSVDNTFASIEFDMRGNILTVNDNFCKVMGYSLNEIKGKHHRIFVDQAYANSDAYRDFWRSLNEGYFVYNDFQRLNKFGRIVWLTASYTPVMNKEGIPYKVIKLAQDITAKKTIELKAQQQAEELRLQGEKLKEYTAELEAIQGSLNERLEEASRDLRQQLKEIEAEKSKNVAILEGCVDGVISFNQEGVIEFFNKAAEEIWGIKREAVVGKLIQTIIPAEIRDNNNKKELCCKKDGKPLNVRTEVTVTNAVGAEVAILLTLTEAKVEGQYKFTVFVQRISVELF